MFVLNDADDIVPVVTKIFAFSPGFKFVTLKCVVALFAKVTVKKLPAFISIDAVLLATVTATTLPIAEPVIINEPDIIAEPVKGNVVVNPVTALPLITYNVFGSLVTIAAYDAEVKVTIFVTAGTVVYVSYMFEIKLPL